MKMAKYNNRAAFVLNSIFTNNVTKIFNAVKKFHVNRIIVCNARNSLSKNSRCFATDRSDIKR